MHKLRPVSIALAAIMIASALSGCGDGDIKAISTPAGSISQTTTTDPAAEAAAQAEATAAVKQAATAKQAAAAAKAAVAKVDAAKQATAAKAAATRVDAARKAAAVKAPVGRDANGFALGGPPQATAPANYDHPSSSDCMHFRDEVRAWSKYQNQHRPAGSTNKLPSSGEVQYLSIVCHLEY